MSRGWIYQESAFGQLDPDMVQRLSGYLYDEYRRPHDYQSAGAFVRIVWNIAAWMVG